MLRLLSLFLLTAAMPALGHELWIEPEEFQIAADGKLQARIVNGEAFEGVNLPYLPRNFMHFVAFHEGQASPVQGRLGDTPALNMDAMGDGLHVIAYQSRNATVDYATWEKFQSFVDHKDLGDVLSRHEARGLPLEDFKEVYSRYSKSLIAAGDGAGADFRTGLETEIVALDNPYADAPAEIRLQLFYRQDVRADEQIEVFERAPDGSVSIFLVRTDAEGIASVLVKAGHDYMADAVVLREPTAEVAAQTNGVWETLWANLTWSMPE